MNRSMFLRSSVGATIGLLAGLRMPVAGAKEAGTKEVVSRGAISKASLRKYVGIPKEDPFMAAFVAAMVKPVQPNESAVVPLVIRVKPNIAA